MRSHLLAASWCVVVLGLLIQCISPAYGQRQVKSVPVISASGQTAQLREEAIQGMKRAAKFFRERVATHGGYVYHYDIQLDRRWGEGEATKDQIWVQPPGTPSVGMAYVAAFEATGDAYYLAAVQEVADALRYGQLRSGGWTNCIDFDPAGKRVAQYIGQPKRGKNNSSLDDGQTQTAIEFMVRADQVLGFRNQEIHQSAQLALDSLLAAQFPSGGFPQVWTGPVAAQPIVRAGYPEYEWRTEGRIKEYWNLYTLNDNLAVDVAQTLITAHEVYGDARYRSALERLGDFLLLAQMPEPQPAWAQQYNYQMQPVWARRFEPPAVCGHESFGIIGLLMRLYTVTGEDKYLRPIQPALDYLRRSELSDGQIARYYELKTNRPLYMQRDGDVYSLTYDDSRLPSHYSWKTSSKVSKLLRQYDQLKRSGPQQPASANQQQMAGQVQRILGDLDSQGRWLTTARGERLVGQAKIPQGEQFISSAAFSENVQTLAKFIDASKPE